MLRAHREHGGFTYRDEMAQSWTAEQPEAEVTVNDASDIPFAAVELFTVVPNGLAM